MNKRVAIIGKGAWGKAMYHVISQNTSAVRLVGRGEMVTEEIIVIAVPTNNIRELASVLQPKSKNPSIINTSKGIEEKTYSLPREIIKDMFPECHYLTLIGPGFAGEVMEDMPTIVNLGYGLQKEEGAAVAALFQTDSFRVRQAEAVHTLELSAALKNVYAIGCGLADGLGYASNTRTFLTVVAIEEMQRFFLRLGLGIGPHSTAGTIGDLVLTSNSPESRNFSFGRALATMSVSSALQRVKGVVEGYTSLDAISHLEETSGGKLPLASFIQRVVKRNDPKIVRKDFTTFIKTI